MRDFSYERFLVEISREIKGNISDYLTKDAGREDPPQGPSTLATPPPPLHLSARASVTAFCTRTMSSAAAISNSAVPQSLVVCRPKLGDSFSDTRSLRTASERAMLADGRSMVTDHRVTGGHGKMYRCSGAIIVPGKKETGGCQAHVKANKRADKHFYVTSVSFEHENCAGGKKNPSVRALAAEGAVVVNANRKVTASGIVKTLKGSHGVELKPWSASRLKRQVVSGSKAEQTADIQRFASFMHKLADGSPGTITDCQVGGWFGLMGVAFCVEGFCLEVLASSGWVMPLSVSQVEMFKNFSTFSNICTRGV